MDGLEIRDVPLSLLRAGVTVISQDAQLFSGNVRQAIDPLGQVTILGHIIWQCFSLYHVVPRFKLHRGSK